MKSIANIINTAIALLLTVTPLISQDADSILLNKIAEAKRLRATKQYKAAIDLLRSHLALHDNASENTPEIGEAYHNIGLNYYLFGQYDSAKHYMGITLDRRLNTAKLDSSAIARAYFLREAIKRNSGDLSGASKDLKLAIATMEPFLEDNPNARDTRRLLNMYEEGARLHRIQGDFTTAKSYWEKAFDFYQKESSIYQPQIARLHLLRGNLEYEQKKYRLAEANFVKAVQTFESLGHDRFKRDLAGSHNNLGLFYLEQSRLNEALFSFNKALGLFEEMYEATDAPDFQLAIANTYANLIRLYTLQEDYAKVNMAYANGLKAGNAVWPNKLHPTIAELHLHKGAALEEQGLNQLALINYQAAMESVVPGFKSQRYEGNPSIKDRTISEKRRLLQILTRKANVLYQNARSGDNLTTAYHTYLVIDTLVTQIRQSYLSAGSRYNLMDQVIPVYEQAIHSALQLYETKQDQQYLNMAYTLAAKNKALILLEGLQDERAKVFAGIPEELLGKENDLKKNIYDLEKEIYEFQQQNKDSLTQILKDSLFQYRRQYERLIDELERNYPTYFQLKYQFPSALDISSIQQDLSEEALLFEYFVGENKLFIFLIGKTHFAYHQLDKPKNFEARCSDFRALTQGLKEEGQQEYLKVAYQLFEWLIKTPLAVGNLDGITRLFIIPHGVLLQISFDGLIDEPIEEWQGADNPYLLKKYAISYAYSNRLLFDETAAARVRRAKGGFAGFGLEYDDYTLEGLGLLKEDTVINNRSIGRLVYSDDEVRELADLLNGEEWLNRAATKTAFLEYAPDYGILHLAMHGVVDEQNPMNSALIFTRTSDSIDYLLRAYDLYGVNMNAQMAVLSACNTGYGALVRGEGVRSLARAFAYAGCPNLVATLWSASDKSTKDVLLNYYENLKTGMTKDVALQQAKLTYLQDAPPTFTAPFYWSHLISIGEQAPIQLVKSYPAWLLGLLGVGIVFFAFFIWKKMGRVER